MCGAATALPDWRPAASTVYRLLRRAGEIHAFAGHVAKAEPLLREALAMAERVHGPQGTGTILLRLSLARHLARQCLPDPIQPEDMAGVVLFLASDASRMMTSQTLILDGGYISS